MASISAQEKLYTMEDIYALPDGKRADMQPPLLYTLFTIRSKPTFTRTCISTSRILPDSKIFEPRKKKACAYLHMLFPLHQ